MGQHYGHLSAEERGAIMVGKARGESARQLALMLGRSPSTISRELARNGHQEPSVLPRMGRPRLSYDASRAGQRARRLARKPRRERKLRRDGQLWCLVRRLLGKGWSPQQVSRTLRRHHPDERAKHVSHETIYTAIYAAPRGELRRAWSHFCGSTNVRVGRVVRVRTGAAGCTTCRAFMIVHSKPMNGCCPATGKATSSKAPVTDPRWAYWWIVGHVS